VVDVYDAAADREWMRRRHDAMRTPRVIIDAQVRVATGAGLQTLRRLVVGEDNEVYEVTTTGGDRLIVRISHAEDPRFEAERWALDVARAAGVPTPVVLHVQPVAVDDGQAVTFCIEEKLPGVPLDALLDDNVWPERAIGQLGELLSAIHANPVDGFGYLQPDGRGWPITLDSIMTDLIPRRARVLETARHWRVEHRLVAAGLDALAGHTELYSYDDPRLLHGDFSLDHILVDGAPGHEYVSGVLDMQECAGGHPASDIAYWLAISDKRIPLTTLLATYPGGSDFVDRNADLIALMTLRRALSMLMVDQDRGNSSRIGDHVCNIEGALTVLRHHLGNAATGYLNHRNFGHDQGAPRPVSRDVG
jgi:aminoglycoside phosphotransferase (APT) family kinase protein